MEQSEQAGTVKIRPLGGVNERISPVDLPASEFSEVKGLFPSQNGILERIWGNKFLTKFDEAVLSITPTYNLSRHIFIQTASKRYLTTLDELFGRNEYTGDLTPATGEPGHEIVEEDSILMSMAILVGQKGAGVTGKAIGTAYAARDLTAINWNDGGIVTGLAANKFTLGAGSYRFRSTCLNCNAVTLGSQQLFQHILYNETNAANLLTVAGLVTAASTSFYESTPARIDNVIENVHTYLSGTFTLSGPCDISCKSKTNNVVVTDGALPCEGKPTNFGAPETYTVIEIYKTA